MPDQPTTEQLTQFVLHETRLLNAGDHEAWLALFLPEGRYWVPLSGSSQPDSTLHASLADEDHFLLSTRIRRLRSSAAHSLQPGVCSLHVVQQPEVVDPVDGDSCLHTPFVYTETGGGRTLRLAGIWRHRLRATPDGLRIVQKRVDLLDADAAHEIIQLFP